MITPGMKAFNELMENTDFRNEYIDAVNRVALQRQFQFGWTNKDQAEFVAGAAVIFSLIDGKNLRGMPPHWYINIIRDEAVFTDHHDRSPGFTKTKQEWEDDDDDDLEYKNELN